MNRFITLTVIVVALCATAEADTPKPDSLTIGPRFHYETSYGDHGIKAENVSWGKKEPLYKVYDGAAKTRLPAPSFSGVSVETVIRNRKSVRSFTNQSLTLEQLAQVLWSADGITRQRGRVEFRTAPSGGALYPIDIYVIASGVDTLPDGLYHYQVSDNSLELIEEGNFSQRIHKASGGQGAVGASPATIIITARFGRITRKYADRGYRYIYMEAGAICENIYLQATSLGLGTVAVGAFNDDAVNKLLNVNGTSEAVLLIMPLGVPQEH